VKPSGIETEEGIIEPVGEGSQGSVGDGSSRQKEELVRPDQGSPALDPCAIDDQILVVKDEIAVQGIPVQEPDDEGQQQDRDDRTPGEGKLALHGETIAEARKDNKGGSAFPFSLDNLERIWFKCFI